MFLFTLFKYRENDYRVVLKVLLFKYSKENRYEAIKVPPNNKIHNAVLVSDDDGKLLV